MNDNTVLDALETLQKIKQMYNLKSTKSDKAIPIYNAEQAVVEAAIRYCKLRALESPSFNQVQERIIELGNMYEAIDNLKELKHDR